MGMKVKKNRFIQTKIPKGQHSVFENFPYKRMDGNLMVLENDTYVGFLRVTPQNVKGMTDQSKKHMMDNLRMIENIFDSDHKIVALKFPINIDEQLRFWNKMLTQRRKENDLYGIKSCQQNIRRLRQFEKHFPSSAFYFEVYGDTKEVVKDRLKRLQDFGGTFLNLKTLTSEEVIQLIRRLNNMNTI